MRHRHHCTCPHPSSDHGARLNPQNCPLHEKTKGLFNKELISRMRHGAWLVNTARGAICVAEDVAEALASGQLNGYAGDVWSGFGSNRWQPYMSSI
jgi:lactate dehydrogenase-like 2-hydroxyacid dehydrogenase